MLVSYIVLVAYLLIGFSEAGYWQRQQPPYPTKSRREAVLFYFSDGFETFLVTIFWLPILFWNLLTATVRYLFGRIKRLVKKLRKIFKRKSTANTTTGQGEN